MQAICNGDYKFEPVSPPPADKTHADGQAEYWAGVSDTAKQFVKSCLTIDPSNRPTSDELLNHPWLKDGASTKNVDLLPNVKSAFNAKKTCKLDLSRSSGRTADSQSERPYLVWWLLSDSKIGLELVIQRNRGWQKKCRISKMKLNM
jgi:serine/threonine protein kinase